MSDINETTNMYPVMSAAVLPVLLKKVPDLATGGTRNRRYACYISVAVIQDLNEHSDPLIINADMPKLLVDGDTIKDVKERVYSELEIVFENAQDLIDGKVTMEDLEQQAVAEAEKLQEEARKEIEELIASTPGADGDLPAKPEAPPIQILAESDGG